MQKHPDSFLLQNRQVIAPALYSRAQCGSNMISLAAAASLPAKITCHVPLLVHQSSEVSEGIMLPKSERSCLHDLINVSVMIGTV